jgi:hypothetical protein
LSLKINSNQKDFLPLELQDENFKKKNFKKLIVFLAIFHFPFLVMVCDQTVLVGPNSNYFKGLPFFDLEKLRIIPTLNDFGYI